MTLKETGREGVQGIFNASGTRTVELMSELLLSHTMTVLCKTGISHLRSTDIKHDMDPNPRFSQLRPSLLQGIYLFEPCSFVYLSFIAVFYSLRHGLHTDV